MKPLRPYITLSDTSSPFAYELSVVIYSPPGHTLQQVDIRTEADNNQKQQDVVEFLFRETPGTNEFTLDQNYNMARTMNQDTVTVFSTVIDSSGPKPGNGSSTGHYGDPTP